MRFLARVYEHTGHQRFRTGFQKGIDYLLDAQYENGGWPQYYPIREGYYEHITFNDGAMIGVMRILRDVSNGHFSFVDSSYKEPATNAIRNGLQLILQTRIVVEGELTAWCTQYNHETLEPAWARAYEPPSISGSESRHCALPDEYRRTGTSGGPRRGGSGKMDEARETEEYPAGTG
ncbi:MAG: pectate lyase [Balneolaceae bacterium]|nr:pectate lyase [Balneolaceae bacterium]